MPPSFSGHFPVDSVFQKKSPRIVDRAAQGSAVSGLAARNPENPFDDSPPNYEEEHLEAVQKRLLEAVLSEAFLYGLSSANLLKTKSLARVTQPHSLAA